MKIQVVVPTYNAGAGWRAWIDALSAQKDVEYDVMVIDSSSTDNTVIYANQAGYRTVVIKKDEFNHGSTRQMALELNNETDIYLYMTQDAILANQYSFANLLEAFSDMKIGAAYGCQVPKEGAGFFESFARRFNYPEGSIIKGKQTINSLGLKTVFLSNSFAAYRRQAILDAGGFPEHVIMAEDMYVAAKMVLAGWDIAYCPEAKAYHSHSYTVCEEFKRYFDTGVFHAREPWIKESFGGASGEGTKFAVTEIKELLSESPLMVPVSMLRNSIKWIGFRLGINERLIPVALKRSMSMHCEFWDRS
jgi:rhamnosyltransferase